MSEVGTSHSEALNPSFVIEQSGRYRHIDDLKRSRVSYTTFFGDTYKPDSLGALILHNRLIYITSGDVEIKISPSI